MLLHNRKKGERGFIIEGNWETGFYWRQETRVLVLEIYSMKSRSNLKPFQQQSGFVDKWMHVWPVTVKCELFLHLADLTVNHH